MDVLIIGAGAIGSLLAYKLGAAGHRVTAVGRAPYVLAVGQRGLLVEQNGRARRADRLTAVESVEGLDTKFDLVIITAKAFDTAVAVVQALRFVQEGAAAILMQNGVGGVEIASGILGEQSLYAGVITIPVQTLKPAVIRPTLHKGGIAIAPVAAEQDPKPWVDLFERASFQARSYANWRTIKWSKLMLNLIANAIPAILDWPLEQVYADPRLCNLERRALLEARAVVNRMKVELVSLPGYPVPLLVWALCTLPAQLALPIFRRVILASRGGKIPSLHIDLNRGRDKSEVEFLNGAIVRAGKGLNVPTPVNRLLCETLMGIVRGQTPWAQYQGQAERLIHQADPKASPL